MLPAGPTIPASEQPHTHDLDRAATGIGKGKVKNNVCKILVLISLTTSAHNTRFRNKMLESSVLDAHGKARRPTVKCPLLSAHCNQT